jgi:tetratricopeptide (TPR) repeat protein
MKMSSMKPGRNDPCPCGSGRRYKHCCGLLPAAAAAAPGPGSPLAVRDSQPEAEGLIEAADVLRSQGRVAESVPLYRQALAIQPHYTAAHNNLGNALLQLGEFAPAAAAYRLALAESPENADIHCNLGNALRQLGELPEALLESERAIALNPQLSMAHNNLGLLLAQRGQRAEAALSYRRALSLNPAYIEALNNLGNVLRELGESREAVALYRRAIELDPQRAESHCSLGTVLCELQRLEEAAVSFRQALALHADYAQAHLGLATALRMQGRGSEAEASCRQALALEPKNVEALALLGELHADRGRFAEAQQLFHSALAIDPHCASVYCSLATHRKMTTADGDWLRGAEGLLAKQLPVGHEISLRYALGKYCDDLQHYDQAFGHYRRANELTKRYGRVYDAAKLTRHVDQIMRSCDAAVLRQQHGEACASELPVFILGMPRSGTSLAEQILASHPQVFGAGELRFWNKAFGAFAQAQLKSDDGATLIPGMARAYLERVTALAGGAPRVVDKMPANFLYVGLIHAALPRARFIHMQRHPIDTCLSIYFQNFFDMGPHANDLGSLAHYYGEYLRITSHWRAVLPATALLEVPYEALIADQHGWTRRMVDFIGLPWDPRCLEFHHTERVVMTASRWQVRQKLNATSVGRWRNYEHYIEPLRALVGQAAQAMRVASGRPSSGS